MVRALQPLSMRLTGTIDMTIFPALYIKKGIIKSLSEALGRGNVLFRKAGKCVFNPLSAFEAADNTCFANLSSERIFPNIASLKQLLTD